MIQSEYNNHLITLQCKYSTWADKFDKALKFGICAREKTLDNISIAFMLPAMMRYKFLEGELTSAFLVCITGTLGPSDVLTIRLGATIKQYTGSYSLSTILSDFNAVSETTGYTVVISGTCLVFYSTDPSKGYDIKTYAPSVSIFIAESGDAAKSVTSLEGQYELEDALNCLTFEQLCALKGRISFLLTNAKCN